MSSYKEYNKAFSPLTPVYDSKWRFFWPIGEKSKEVDSESLACRKVLPKGFPQWESVMDGWGNKMLSACETAAQMAALGFGLPENTFTERMKFAHHLLAPTGSDLKKFDEGTVFAGFHYDLNFLTIHGKSNYPGLFVWLRDGTKKKVKVPDGCLLLQVFHIK
jgi:isopenicillin N synthase-like dioxygenase